MWTMPTAEAVAFQDAVNHSGVPIPDCLTVLTLSATDSVDLAMMFARRVSRRRKILAYRYGYHGHGGLAALATGSTVEGVLEHYSLPQDLSGFFETYGSLDEIERMIGDGYAAIILEPMNYETFEPAPAGYLEGVQALCRQHGVLLVVDETRTGLSRSGQLWMSCAYAISPDVLILGKGLGGGYYPVSALITTREIYDECMNGSHWGFMSSMAGSPIGAIVAMKVIEIAQRPDLLANVRRLETALRTGFEDLCHRFQDVYRPSHVRGGIATLGLASDALGAVIAGELFDHNVLCHSVSEIKPSVVKFFPSLTSDLSSVAELLSALEAVARKRQTSRSRQ
jgi:acetylornithine aminotransferase